MTPSSPLPLASANPSYLCLPALCAACIALAVASTYAAHTAFPTAGPTQLAALVAAQGLPLLSGAIAAVLLSGTVLRWTQQLAIVVAVGALAGIPLVVTLRKASSSSTTTALVNKVKIEPEVEATDETSLDGPAHGSVLDRIQNSSAATAHAPEPHSRVPSPTPSATWTRTTAHSYSSASTLVTPSPTWVSGTAPSAMPAVPEGENLPLSTGAAVPIPKKGVRLAGTPSPPASIHILAPSPRPSTIHDVDVVTGHLDHDHPANPSQMHSDTAIDQHRHAHTTPAHIHTLARPAPPTPCPSLSSSPAHTALTHTRPPTPDCCIEDEVVRIFRIHAAKVVKEPTPCPPWPKEWPVYWEGAGPAGLGRWA